MSYNVFFSSLTPRAEPSLLELGFELPVAFPTIESEREGIQAKPDFLLYDGASVLLIEVKSGNNINDHDIAQVREYDRIPIEVMEEYLQSAEVQERTSYEGNVDTIETAISYQKLHEAYVENCRNNWPECRENLQQLEEYAAVLAQDSNFLRTVAGEFSQERINDLFKDGIDLPANPRKEFTLTETVEAESLAVAICKQWGHRAAQGPVEVKVSEIRSHFAPRHAVRFGRVWDVLEFLDYIDACDFEKIEEGGKEESTCEFTMDHMDSILNIEEIVTETKISEYSLDDDQSNLDNFP